MRGPAPRARALPPSRGPGGLPITALHDRGLRGHSTLRKAITKDEVSEAPRTPKGAWIKDACSRAHSGAAGRDPSCQSLLPSSRNTSRHRRLLSSPRARPQAPPGQKRPSSPAGHGVSHPSLPCLCPLSTPGQPAGPHGGGEPTACQHRPPVRPEQAGEEAGKASVSIFQRQRRQVPSIPPQAAPVKGARGSSKPGGPCRGHPAQAEGGSTPPDTLWCQHDLGLSVTHTIIIISFTEASFGEKEIHKTTANHGSQNENRCPHLKMVRVQTGALKENSFCTRILLFKTLKMLLPLWVTDSPAAYS